MINNKKWSDFSVRAVMFYSRKFKSGGIFSRVKLYNTTVNLTRLPEICGSGYLLMLFI